jgi:nitroimidazol reductase NimA-like FMN-containing flavoprotein (pyridoxamine 5'-phosphate oxidase superfamily)
MEARHMQDPQASRPYMPDYGLAPAERQLLPWSWAEELLAAAWTYWLGTTRPDGRPHLMPVWAVYAESRVLFSTSANSRKAGNIELNPACTVAVEVDRQSLIIEGYAAVLQDSTLRARFNEIYLAKYEYDMSDWSDPVYAVTPRLAFAFIDQPGKFESTATRWAFAGP